MLDKVFYFKVGEKDIRIALPENGLGKFFTLVMCGIFVFDLMIGHIFGMLLMGLFIAMNVLQVK